MAKTANLNLKLLAAVGMSTSLLLTGCTWSGNANTGTTGTAAGGGTPSSQGGSTAAGSQALVQRANRVGTLALASCLRKHGVHVPPPHESGGNLYFNAKGINTKSALFKGCYSSALAAANAIARG